MVRREGLEPSAHGLKGRFPFYMLSMFSLIFHGLTLIRGFCFRSS